jgi:HEAT repeat protein
VSVPADAPDAVRKVLAELNSMDPQRRAAAATSLGDLTWDQDRSVDVLLQALNDPSYRVRSSAAAALGKQGGGKAVEPLVARLEDPSEDRNVRSASAQALGQLKAVAAVESLIGALADPVWHLRYQAALALGQIGEARAVDPLANVVRYEANFFVREAAEQSLQQLGQDLPSAAQ